MKRPARKYLTLAHGAEFSDRLHYKMEKLGMSAKSLAETVGCSPITMARYRQGRWKPQMEILVALALALNVTTDWLCGLTDEEKPLLKEGKA